jgi:hypothetical protein
MDIRVTLQRISHEEDLDDFVAFLQYWFEHQYPEQHLRLSVDFGDSFHVEVNGLENCDDSWIIRADYQRAAFEYRKKRGRVQEGDLFKRGMI